MFGKIVLTIALFVVLGVTHAASFEDPEQALDHWRGDLALEMLETEANESDPAWLRWYGRAHMQLGEMDVATEAFERALELEPDNSDNHMLLANVLFSGVGGGGIREARQVRRLAEEAAELNPSDPMPRWALFLYYHRVPAILGGTSGRAERQHEALAEIDPRWGRAADGILLLDDGHLESAREAWWEAWDEGVGADVSSNLSYVLAKLEDWDGLFRLKQQWLDRDPGHPRVLYRLGRRAAILGEEAGELHLQAGREALTTYTERAFIPSMLPSQAAAFWRKGQILEVLGEPGSARMAWEQALEIDPDHEEAREALDELDKVSERAGPTSDSTGSAGK